MNAPVLFLLPAGDKGGAEAVIEALVARLDRRRFEPWAVCMRPGPLIADLAAAGARTFTLPAHRARRPIKLVRSVVALRRLVRTAQPAIVHANAGHLLAHATAATRGTATRVVWHVHDPLGNRTLHERAFRWAQRGLQPDVTVFANPAVATSYLAAYPRIGRHRTIVPGVDPERFARADPEAARRAVGVPYAAPLVVTVARLQAFKGHAHLLAAAPRILAAHPAARIVIAGTTLFGREPDLERSLRETAQRLGVAERVVFCGYVPDPVRDGLVAAAAVLVHPADYEPFGLAVLEGMAAGVPVVAADAEGPRLTVGDAGILVPRGDAAALARAVISLLDDPGRAAALGAAGRRRVAAQFSLDAMVSAFEALYAELLADRRTAGSRHG